jgi:FG-GAP repeat
MALPMLPSGAPLEAIGFFGGDGAGAVRVFYGSATGLSTQGKQWLHQETPGIQDEAEGGDAFGIALAAGDFNHDGFADLAIGVPGQTVHSLVGAGAVHIIYGSAQGLSAARNQVLHQDSTGIRGVAEADDRFGTALAAGDFDNDGFVDLAIGMPNQVVGSSQGAGAVQVVYGSAQGLAPAGDRVFDQDSAGFQGKAEMGDVFGLTLAVGDFNRDGFADLSIGVFGQDIGSAIQAGAVQVVYGSAQGLTAAGNRVFHQNSVGIREKDETNDSFGWSLAAGDFNHDGFTDLAIGSPGESIGILPFAGIVHIIYGSADGLSADESQIFHQNSAGMQDEAEDRDGFGFTLAAGDFDNDGFADLAIEVPNEVVANLIGTGAVHVL